MVYLGLHPKTKPNPDLFPVAGRTIVSAARMVVIFTIVEFFENAPLHSCMNGIGRDCRIESWEDYPVIPWALSACRRIPRDFSP